MITEGKADLWAGLGVFILLRMLDQGRNHFKEARKAEAMRS